MTASPSEIEDDTPVFDLKATNFTLPVMHLYDTDMDDVSRELAQRIDEAPDFFENAPVVIELSGLQDTDARVDFALLVGLLRGHGMIPVGVRGGNEEQNAVATAMELAILSGGRGTSRPPRKEVKPQPEIVEKTVVEKVETVMVDRPVRSGQQVYSKGDLIISAQVSSGAEVMAEGNIHIYGVLRGRAMAGVKGDTNARIFCQGLQAELVSIAGVYKVSSDLDDTDRSRPVQIALKDTRLEINPIE